MKKNVTCQSSPFTINIPAAPAVNYQNTVIPLAFTDFFFRDNLNNRIEIDKNSKALITKYRMEVQNFPGARLTKASVLGGVLDFGIEYREAITNNVIGGDFLATSNTSEWQDTNIIVNNPTANENLVIAIFTPQNLYIDLRNADLNYDGITIAQFIMELVVDYV